MHLKASNKTQASSSSLEVSEMMIVLLMLIEIGRRREREGRATGTKRQQPKPSCIVNLVSSSLLCKEEREISPDLSLSMFLSDGEVEWCGRDTIEWTLPSSKGKQHLSPHSSLVFLTLFQCERTRLSQLLSGSACSVSLPLTRKGRGSLSQLSSRHTFHSHRVLSCPLCPPFKFLTRMFKNVSL